MKLLKKKRRLSTPTGMSINEIALNLKQQDPSLSFSDAKKEAKKIRNARDTLENGMSGLAGKAKKVVLKSMFGDKLGGIVSKLVVNRTDQEEAAKLLSSYKDQTETNKNPLAKILKKEFKSIKDKINDLSEDVKQIKSINIPIMAAAINRNSEVIRENLNTVSDTKKPVTEVIKKEPQSKAKFKVKMKASRIPVNEVGQQVATVMQDINKDPVDPISKFARSESANDNASQVEAKKTNEKLHTDEEKSKLNKKLETILDDVETLKRSNHSFFGLVMAAMIGELLPMIVGIKTILTTGFKALLAALPATLLGGAGVAAAGVAGYMAGDKIVNPLLNEGAKIATGDKKATVGTALFNAVNGSDKVQEIERTKAAGVAFSEKEAIEKQKSTWYDYQSNSYKVVPKEKQKDYVHSDRKGVIQRPMVVPKKAESAARVEAASNENIMSKNESSQSTTIVKQDNRKTIVQQGKSGGGTPAIFLKVRNDEPTIASYVASIFDHPVVHPGIYKM